MNELFSQMELDAETLTQLRFFRGESPDAIEWVLDACVRKRLPAGEVLLEPGQHNDELFVLLSGQMSVKLVQNGDTISTLVQGDCAGEMSLLDSTHTSAWVTAQTDCEVMVLDAEHLWSLITNSHIVALNLLSILSERVRSDNLLIDKSQQLKNFYEYHARVDALTGLNNRRWLENTMARFTRRSHLDGDTLSLIMLDIDYFKAYNDTHGHLCGDIALRCVAQAIQQNIRPNDFVARYGGEEFVVLMPNTDGPEAAEVAERLCEAVRSAKFRDRSGQILPHVTVSAGVACGEPTAADGSLMAEADAALYRAKHMGRDCVSR